MELDKLHAEAAENQRKICRILNWGSGQLCMFIFDEGYRYLELYFGDKEAAQVLTRRVQFWNWWRTMWYARDAAFVEDAEAHEANFDPNFFEKIYRHLHLPSILADELAPPTSVYPSTFTIIKPEMV